MTKPATMEMRCDVDHYWVSVVRVHVVRLWLPEQRFFSSKLHCSWQPWSRKQAQCKRLLCSTCKRHIISRKYIASDLPVKLNCFNNFAGRIDDFRGGCSRKSSKENSLVCSARGFIRPKKWTPCHKFSHLFALSLRLRQNEMFKNFKIKQSFIRPYWIREVMAKMQMHTDLHRKRNLNHNRWLVQSYGHESDVRSRHAHARAKRCVSLVSMNESEFHRVLFELKYAFVFGIQDWTST